jgi:hypothetical protein
MDQAAEPSHEGSELVWIGQKIGERRYGSQDKETNLAWAYPLQGRLPQSPLCSDSGSKRPPCATAIPTTTGPNASYLLLHASALAWLRT